METCTLCSFAPLAFLACVRMKTNIFTVVFMTVLVRPIPFPDLSISTGAHSLLSSLCTGLFAVLPAPEEGLLPAACARLSFVAFLWA